MKNLLKSIKTFIGGLFTKKVVKVFDGEKAIADAQKKVKSALSLFDVATEAVQDANINLLVTISSIEVQEQELLAKLSVAGSTKKSAEDAVDKNIKIVKKLKDFMGD